MQRITTQHPQTRFAFLSLTALMLLMTLALNVQSQAQSATQVETPLAATFETHGGLDHFRTFGTMTYTMKGFPLSAPMAMPNRSTVDLKTRKNRIEGEGFTVAWDGNAAWATPGLEAVGLPARFVTLGSFYFIGMPFVFGDEGVVLTDAGYDTFQGKSYRVINVGYETGIGHTDDDEYAIFIDPDTNRIALIHHSVTENPEVDRVTWTFDAFQEIEGLLIPAKMTFYVGWNPDAPGAPGNGSSFTIEEVTLEKRRPESSQYEASDHSEIAGD